MSPPFRQQLPDLTAYRREFAATGVSLPLREVPCPVAGLLASLPPPPPGRTGWPWTVQTAPAGPPATSWPKITIVTPSFQQGDFIEETLRSVLLQNYPRLEFIIIDGGSKDQTPAVIERYRPWLSFARIARDRGQSHAINLGFSLASGDIFAWLNSDDFLLPGALRRVAEAWRRGAEFIYGDGLEIEEATGRLAHAPAGLAGGRYVKFPAIVHSHAAFWSAKRNLPVWEEQHCAMDYELWIRLLPGLRPRHIRWPLAAARRHDASKTHSGKLGQQWAEDSRRNGLAHPDLYRRRPWLDLEFRIRSLAVQVWRSRGLATRLAQVWTECRWEGAPPV